jgi:hypothetical protein
MVNNGTAFCPWAHVGNGATVDGTAYTIVRFADTTSPEDAVDAMRDGRVYLTPMSPEGNPYPYAVCRRADAERGAER